MQAVVIEADFEPRAGYRLSDWERENRRAIDGNKVWRNPRWSVQERPVPEISRPDEVLLRVRACGMCGSDVHMYETDDDGYIMLAYKTKFPVIVGHEFAGEVVEVGSGVTRFRPGDGVAVEEINWCGECRACKFGLPNQCTNAEDLGLTVDGGFAEYVLVRERYCWSLNNLREAFGDEKAFAIGALTEPTSVTYEGMFRRAGGFLPGSHVGVFGCGPIGLAAVQLARAAGAAKVIAVDTQAGRRDIATETGADLALDPREVAAAGSTVAEEILRATSGEGIAMAVECSGLHAAVFPEIENCLDVNGKVSVIGMDAHAAPVTTGKYQFLAGQIYGSLGHCGGDFGLTISMHAAGRIDMTRIVTAEYPLAEGVDAVRKTAERVDAKVFVKP